MKVLNSLLISLAFLCCVCGSPGEATAASKLEDPIFSDGVTLEWFARKACAVRVEIKIAPSGGGGPDISSEEQIDSKQIPNTLGAIYAIFPRLRDTINGIYAGKDDYYLMISEILSEPGCKEKVSSFIGAYAREIK